MRLADELQFSIYNFEEADVEKAWKHFDLYEAECHALVDQFPKSLQHQKLVDDLNKKLLGEKDESQVIASPKNVKSYPILAAYDLCLKCSHLFNILDARGAISVTERVGVIARVRALAVGIAKAWVDQQKADAPAKADEPEPVREKKANARKGILSTVGGEMRP